MNAATYRAQTNAWNNHVKFARNAGEQFISEARKAKFIEQSEAAYVEYVQAGGTNSKNVMFSI